MEKNHTTNANQSKKKILNDKWTVTTDEANRYRFTDREEAFVELTLFAARPARSLTVSINNARFRAGIELLAYNNMAGKPTKWQASSGLADTLALPKTVAPHPAPTSTANPKSGQKPLPAAGGTIPYHWRPSVTRIGTTPATQQCTQLGTDGVGTDWSGEDCGNQLMINACDGGQVLAKQFNSQMIMLLTIRKSYE